MIDTPARVTYNELVHSPYCRLEALKLEIPRRSQVIAAHKHRGGGVAAVLPVHSPRGLLRAFNLLPVEVWGPPRVNASLGAAHLQPYICSIVRNALGFLLSDGLEVADVILVPHTCDSLQGLGSLLLDFIKPRQSVLTLYLPRSDLESATTFLTEELRRLYEKLRALTGASPDEQELLACLRREETADQLLAELHRRRAWLPLSLLEFYRLVRSREYLPAEDFCRLAQTALAQTSPAPQRRGIPLIFSGILPEPMEVLEHIEALGGWIAADDFASCGRRCYPPGDSQEPFLRLAESLLAGPPDPLRGCDLRARLEYLIDQARRVDARGVVFYLVKFCEPELFYLPLLRAGLHQEGLRVLVLEHDLNDGLSQATLTRLEAFLETLA